MLQYIENYVIPAWEKDTILKCIINSDICLNLSICLEIAG